MLRERGFFWWFNESNLPAHSKETSVPSLLTITDDGQITLEADGSLCLKDEYKDWSKPRTFPPSRRIAGWLASKGEYVLLEDIERTDLAFSDESPQQQRFGAQMCTRRDSPFPEAYGRDNFIALRIELTGFEEWLGLESITVDREYSEGDEVHVRVSYKEWELKYPVLGGVSRSNRSQRVRHFSCRPTFGREIPNSDSTITWSSNLTPLAMFLVCVTRIRRSRNSWHCLSVRIVACLGPFW